MTEKSHITNNSIEDQYNKVYLNVAISFAALSETMTKDGAVVVKDGNIVSHAFSFYEEEFVNPVHDEVFVMTDMISAKKPSAHNQSSALIVKKDNYTPKTVENVYVKKNKLISASLACITKLSKKGVSSEDCELYCLVAPDMETSIMIKQMGFKKVYFKEFFKDNKDGIMYLYKNNLCVRKDQ